MADNCMIAAINWCWEDSGIEFSGGSWVATETVKLANLKNIRPTSYARTTSAARSATRLRVAFSTARRWDHLFIGWANLSNAGRFRVLEGGPPLDLDLTAQTPGEPPAGFTFARSTEASYFDDSGVLQWAGVDEPRYDHDPLTGDPKGYLHETSTDCRAVDSEDLSAWTDDGATVSANADTAPDGATTADRITEKATTAAHGRTRAVTWSAFTRYRVSWFAKNSTRSWQCLRIYDGSATKWAFFNASTGAFGHVSSGITTSVQQLPNGWWRPCVGFQASSGAGAGLIGLYCAAADGGDATPSYAGSTGNRIIAWGVMVESGDGNARPSSYVRTTTSNVTRAADGGLVLSGTGFADIVPSGGPLTLGAQVAFAPYQLGVGPVGPVLVDDGTGSNYVAVGGTGGNGNIGAAAVTGGSTQFSATAAGTLGTAYRVVVAVAGNDTRAVIDGTLSAADMAISVPTVTRLVIGAVYNAHIARVCLAGGRVADADLEAVAADFADIDELVPAIVPWTDFVPVTHTPVGGYIPFGRPSADGKMPADERDPRGVSRLVVLDAAVETSGCTIEFDDTANPAGYLQFSVPWIGMGERARLGPAEGGVTIGPVEEAKRTRTPGGTLHLRRLWIRRRVAVALDWQESDQALAAWFETAMRAGGTAPVLLALLAPIATAPVDEPRFSILGVLDEPSPVEHQTLGWWRWAIAIAEL
jgi:hypothetical protein